MPHQTYYFKHTQTLCKLIEIKIVHDELILRDFVLPLHPVKIR